MLMKETTSETAVIFNGVDKMKTKSKWILRIRFRSKTSWIESKSHTCEENSYDNVCFQRVRNGKKPQSYPWVLAH